MAEPSPTSDHSPDVQMGPSFTYGAPAIHGTPPVDGAPGYGAPPAAVRRRRTWDLVLTVILLVVGFFGLLIGLFYAWAFSDPALLDQAMGQGGMGGFDGTVGAGPAIIAVSHIALYLVALGVSILLLATKRIAFWVPLSAGVIAAIVFWGVLISILMSDPDLMGGLYR